MGTTISKRRIHPCPHPERPCARSTAAARGEPRRPNRELFDSGQEKLRLRGVHGDAELREQAIPEQPGFTGKHRLIMQPSFHGGETLGTESYVRVASGLKADQGGTKEEGEQWDDAHAWALDWFLGSC